MKNARDRGDVGSYLRFSMITLSRDFPILHSAGKQISLSRSEHVISMIDVSKQSPSQAARTQPRNSDSPVNGEHHWPGAHCAR
ncbi:hypothetical protein GQ607_007805 [Colletotrichum asianum]|uniref:Uncharacterized protein n=1 Tax=Colletotrichum asianum TaxID=702518 RepID=A0A8H3WFJ5_9PEZI|nr:hypothetical protein GQ607_007805 [Colletotrichum asianum]